MRYKYGSHNGDHESNSHISTTDMYADSTSHAWFRDSSHPSSIISWQVCSMCDSLSVQNYCCQVRTVVAMHVDYGARDFQPIRWDIARLPGTYDDVNRPCPQATPSDLGCMVYCHNSIPGIVLYKRPLGRALLYSGLQLLLHVEC